MIVPNLNPSQLKAANARPQSASLRTPRGGDQSFARLRDGGQATPRAQYNPETTPGEEEPWLFSFHRPLTTADVWKMGFSRVMIFGAHQWADSSVAAAELSEAFGARTPLPGFGLEHKEALEAMIAPAFLRGDVLLAVQFLQCAEADKPAAAAIVAKFLDAVSTVWMQYDEMGEGDLGAVVVVIEGFKGDSITADWAGDGASPVPYPVATLDEAFSVFFK